MSTTDQRSLRREEYARKRLTKLMRERDGLVLTLYSKEVLLTPIVRKELKMKLNSVKVAINRWNKILSS